MSGLRERRHAETKQNIRNAAFALFDEIGYAATTMDQIAERSEVSRSTLYRRFANKDEIVLTVAREWLASWDEAVNAADPRAPLVEVIAAGCTAVALTIDGTQQRVLASYRALAESPALQSSGAATTDWPERFVALVLDREPGLDLSDARTIAGAYLGAIDAMMMHWAAGDGATSVAAATERMLTRLASILP